MDNRLSILSTSSTLAPNDDSLPPRHPVLPSLSVSMPKAPSTIAVHDTIYPSWSNPSKTSPITWTFFDNTDKTLRLPNELRAAFLRLSLPEVDILACRPTAGVCRSYVVRLYALRQVSASWRDLVDGTPSLWATVSSMMPAEVISVCLSRSKAQPLLIHYRGPGARGLNRGWTSFPQFFELTKPHRHRWAMAWLYIPPKLAVGIFNEVMPLLHTVNLMSAGGMPSATDTPFGAEFNVLQNVVVHGGPASWVLGHFRGLRTWRLKGLRGGGLTTEHILGILRENLLLEMLEMDQLAVQILPDNIPLTPIPLLRLTSLTICSCSGELVDHILRRIRIPIDRVNQFCITVGSWGSLNPVRLLTDVLASSSPAFQRAHQTCGGSKFYLSNLGTFYWGAIGNGTTFRLSFAGLKPVTGVQWMAGILSQVDEPKAGASIECQSTALENLEDLKSLGSTDMITAVHVCVDHSEASLQALLQALGDPATPAFPSLQILTIKGFSCDMESIVKMLQVRFTASRTGITQLPRLKIVVSYPEWSDDDSPFQRQIIDFGTVKAIYALNGVYQFHLGCSIGQDGMLGVVWSDKLGGPTWG